MEILETNEDQVAKIKLNESEIDQIVVILGHPDFDPFADEHSARAIYLSANPTWSERNDVKLERLQGSPLNQMLGERLLVAHLKSLFVFEDRKSRNSVISQMVSLEASAGDILVGLFTFVRDTEQPGRVLPPTLEHPIQFSGEKTRAEIEKERSRSGKKFWQFWK